MNTNLLRIVLSALVCALMASTSGCGGGAGALPPQPSQTTGANPQPRVIISGVTETREPVSVTKSYDQCASGSSLRIQVQDTNFQSLTSEDKLMVSVKGGFEANVLNNFKATLEATLAEEFKNSIAEGITHMEGVAFDVKEHTKSEVVFNFDKVKRVGTAEFQGASADFGFRTSIEYMGMVSRDVPCPTAEPGISTSTPTNTPTPSPSSTPTPTLTPKPSCRVGDTFLRTSDAMVMMCVPAGTFQMGSETGESREKPVHEVTLDSFWIDRTEVTNSQYAQCVEAKQCHEPLDKRSASRAFYYGNPDFAHYPVSNARWIDAQSYCAWAGGQLPTEAQWEYAARGPKGNIYPWGNDPPNNELLNYNKAVGNTTEVGSYPRGASWVGALDMAGNDWEWVNDWQGAYPDSPQTNPTGPASGQFKLLRGGSWFFPGDVARTTFRAPGNSPDNYGQDYGFRCVAAGLGK